MRVHTFFMSYALDCSGLSNDNRVHVDAESINWAYTAHVARCLHHSCLYILPFQDPSLQPAFFARACRVTGGRD